MKRVLVTFLFVYGWINAEVINFNYVNTGSNQSVLINSSVEVVGQIEDGSLIGAFYEDENGGLKCAGSSTWINNQSNGFAIWGSNGADTDGFAEGENITWYTQNPNGDLLELSVIYGDGGSNVYQTNSFRWLSSITVIISEGCTDSNFTEYNPFASIDNGSCATPVIVGCLDENSIFYNPNANTPDNSCDPSAIYGCTQAQFYEYNEWATIDDGSCNVYWQALYYDGVWEIEDLQEENDILVAENNSLNSSYTEVLTQKEQLLLQLEQVQYILNSTLGDLAELQGQYDNLSDENLDLQSEVSSQEAQIEQLTIALETGLDNSIAVDLLEGWNIIGFTHRVPMDAGASFEDIMDRVKLIKDNAANLCWPEFGFNGLGDLIPGHGYQIKMNEDVYDFIFPYVEGQRLEMYPQVPDWAVEMAPVHPNDERILVKKMNLLGQDILSDEYKKGEVILYLYSDGSVEKIMH
jgi:hypothetical protein